MFKKGKWKKENKKGKWKRVFKWTLGKQTHTDKGPRS